MRALQVLYSVTLAILVLASIVLTSGQVQAAITMASFGFAFPVFFIPTLALGLLAFAPLVLKLVRPSAGLLLALATIAAVGFGPGAASSAIAARWNREARITHPPVDIHGAARVIEIRYPIAYMGRFLPILYCADVCSELLLTGQVDEVRLVVYDRPSFQTRAYQLGRGAVCVPARDTCVIRTDDASAPSELTIEITMDTSPVRDDGLTLADLTSRTQYRATYRGQVVDEKTDVQARVVTTPALVAARPGGFTLFKLPREVRHADLDDVFRELGYRVRSTGSPLSRRAAEIPLPR
jgi:hypothetical protein